MNPTDETLIQLQNTLANEHDPVKVIDLLFDLGTKLRESLKEFCIKPASDPPDDGRQVKIILRDGGVHIGSFVQSDWYEILQDGYTSRTYMPIPDSIILGWRDLI